ncbi:MAG: MerR family transcriptional regulator [Elusimicrobia bacterium]|nr:MerR family transcriptional regulator [Elusimicrobiota bacterium]
MPEPLRRDKRTPIYNIGCVARLTGLAIWTVRWIERHKLVCPCRSNGNQRLFSDEDVEVLHEIRRLMEEGVNLAGVRVILRMRIEQTGPRQDHSAAPPLSNFRRRKKKPA